MSNFSEPSEPLVTVSVYFKLFFGSLRVSHYIDLFLKVVFLGILLFNIKVLWIGDRLVRSDLQLYIGNPGFNSIYFHRYKNFVFIKG